jgi:hypothetical protein
VRNPRVIKWWEYIILLFVKKQYCYTSDKFFNRKIYIVKDFVYNDLEDDRFCSDCGRKITEKDCAWNVCNECRLEI